MKHVGAPVGFGNLMPFNSTLLSIARHMTPEPKKPMKAHPGSGHHRGRAKLTKEQIVEMHERRSKGQSVRQIAILMNLPEPSVYGVIYNGNGARTLNL